MNSYHIEVVCLALKEQHTLISAALIAAQVFGWKISEARHCFRDETENRMVVGGDIIQAHYQAHSFYFTLRTPDRLVVITEDFLERCGPERRKELLAAQQKLLEK